MRDLFRGYYRPSERKFSELWQTALIVTDANVLLNLYRYSSDTRDRLLSILGEFRDRLWLPHQAAYEFHKNRLKVIFDQQDAYIKVDEILKNHKKDLSAQLNDFRRHPFISVDSLLIRLDRAFDAAIKTVEEQKAKHPRLPDEDGILEAVTELFSGCVGTPYAPDFLEKLYKDGDERYAASMPPGYKDAKTKQGNERFGDLVLWNQIIDQAKEKKLPVILVTDDVKEDWWTRINGKTIGPRPELVDEIYNRSSVDFYMYKIDQFMQFANESIEKQIPAETLKEIRDIRSRTNLDTLLQNDIRTASDFIELQRVLPFRDELEKQKSSMESELNTLTRVLDVVVRNPEEHEVVSSQRDMLRARLRALEAEIGSISSQLSSHSYLDKGPRNWRLSRSESHRDEEGQDLGAKRLMAIKRYLSERTSTPPSSEET